MDHPAKSVAILGGAFDPVHLGHISLAEDAYVDMQLEEVWFLPTAQSPLKGHQAILDASIRIELLEAALKAYPHFKINTSEIERGGVSFTIDTMRRLNVDHPDHDFSWIIGSDQFFQLDQWREIDELAGRLRFLVVSRPGFELNAAKIPNIPKLRFCEVRSRHLDIASSDIRALIADGQAVNDLLPKPVADLIVQRKYYSE